MRIREASLCLRFYTLDGWSRQAVSELMAEPEVERVMPRYFDRDKDNAVPQAKPQFRVNGSTPYADCDYFAILGTARNTDPFDPEKLNEHEISPFGAGE